MTANPSLADRFGAAAKSALGRNLTAADCPLYPALTNRIFLKHRQTTRRFAPSSASTDKWASSFRILSFACFLTTSTAGFAVQPQPNAAEKIHVSADEAAIRSARVELNAALANRDLKTTANYWLPEVHTTGGGGSLWVGLDKNIDGFSKIFKDPNFVSGLRTPDKVEVASGGPKEAAESGIWEWRERAKGQVLTYTGRYLVMWKSTDGKWRIRSELYVTTGCIGGTHCH